MKNEMKVFSGNGNPVLARAICHYLHLAMGEWKLSRFSDGEVYCQILENVRGTDVFVIQPTCHPVNENIMELLIAVDAMKRSSAARITAVIPYYGYARQDRKDKPRVPISAKLVADLLTAAGVDRLLTMELHAPAIQGFFDLPVDHLFAAPVLLDWVERQRFENLTIVSPDAGGVERARAFAKKLEAGLVIIDKRRVEANVARDDERHRRGCGADLRHRGRHRRYRPARSSARSRRFATKGRPACSAASRTPCCPAPRWSASRARPRARRRDGLDSAVRRQSARIPRSRSFPWRASWERRSPESTATPR